MSLDIRKKACNHVNYKAAARSASEIRFLVIHYTGNQGDTAAGNASYFAGNDTGTSAHYFVDETSVWQSVPDEDVAWHCGTSGTYYHANCRNANSIGIEVCMLAADGSVRQGSIARAAQLARQLMETYDIEPEHVVRHYDVTHKDCPAPMVEEPACWTAFQTALAETAVAAGNTEEEETMTQAQFNSMMDTYLKALAADSPDSWSAEARAWAEKNGIIQGDEDGRKQYKAFCTREAMVQFLYRLSRLK